MAGNNRHYYSDRKIITIKAVFDLFYSNIIYLLSLILLSSLGCKKTIPDIFIIIGFLSSISVSLLFFYKPTRAH